MAEKRTLEPGFGAWSYRIFVWGGGLLMLAYLVLPICVALLMSFNSGATLAFPPKGLSLRWYAALLDPVKSAPLHLAALNSLKVALATVVVVTLITAPAALALARGPRRLTSTVEPVLLAPLVLPALVYSLSALLALSLLGLGTSFWTILIGHSMVFAPLMFRTVLGLAQRQSVSLEEASATLGASRLRTFVRVSLPGILPGVFAGAFLVFMQSLDNVDVTLFLGNPGQTMLPMRLFAMLEESLDGRVAAVSGLLILAAALLLITLQRFGGRDAR
ncbi:ABC transporter permease subunit [Pseudooceanicola sp. CBS1P-1]|uniref:ABC transporter permease subunit n=1 Tax=Pseudooceanicola albus TaxID=2692189 RepID=A0A6L7G523_9RHOB|nr:MULTISPECIES: ABC transporter permease subunit [Pseudooceanicola]MBT9386118.1 ABC transporter permease subunit [Pseudooceanicola endophyticus]MXN19464.1 ABC transporter permease subunit [Pseudooceanicola albus]